MARSRYVKKQMEYDAIQYDGDISKLKRFGLEVLDTGYEAIHAHVICHDGIDRACPVGHYIVKNDAGEIEIYSPEKFNMKYEAR